ncbi:hypothetical protein [Nocardia sp. GAS34]
MVGVRHPAQVRKYVTESTCSLDGVLQVRTFWRPTVPVDRDWWPEC